MNLYLYLYLYLYCNCEAGQGEKCRRIWSMCHQNCFRQTHLLLFQTKDDTSPEENKQADQDKCQEHLSNYQSLPKINVLLLYFRTGDQPTNQPQHSHLDSRSGDTINIRASTTMWLQNKKTSKVTAEQGDQLQSAEQRAVLNKYVLRSPVLESEENSAKRK